MITPFRRDVFLSTSTYHRQRFSLTDSIMYYIAKNPKNTEGYQKMVKSCKHFFIKNSILIIFGLRYNQNGWETWIKNGWKNIDMNRISCKLWITYRIRVYPDNKINGTFASSVVPKIYRCDAKCLILYNQIISFNKLMFLCSSVEHLDLHRVNVKYNDGTQVSFEKLVEGLPQLTKMDFTFATNNTSKTTFNALWEISHILNYNYFYLGNIPEDFDIENFHSFLKKNKKTWICLSFSDAISEEYKARLKAIIDEIINAENPKHGLPVISCD
uniref:Uncharacterized protein n=1 Tax=Panagrolaimus superbus TaxID=310955 RepID=A0A914YK29_9BILA